MAIDSAPEKPVESPTLSFYRLSVEQYHEMAEQGILTDEDRVELIEGLLINKMTKNPRHSLATQTLRDAFVSMLPVGWFANDQEPITVGESEPEPDISIVRGKRADYSQHRPTGQDTGLVIEVADSSLGWDRRTKLRIYAQSTIPVYWIVNLVDNKLEVYSEPVTVGDAATYSKHIDYLPADEVPLVLDGREVARLSLSNVFP